METDTSLKRSIDNEQILAPGQIVTIHGLDGRFYVNELHADLKPDRRWWVTISQLNNPTDYWVLGFQEVWSNEREQWVSVSTRGYPASFLLNKATRGDLRVLESAKQPTALRPHQKLVTTNGDHVSILHVYRGSVQYQLQHKSVEDVGIAIGMVGAAGVLLSFIASLVASQISPSLESYFAPLGVLIALIVFFVGCLVMSASTQSVDLPLIEAEKLASLS